MTLSKLMEEKIPSKGMAWGVVILSVLALIFSIAGGFSLKTAMMGGNMMSASSGMGMFGLSVLLSIIAGILQILLLYSWNKAIENNISNTKLVFQLAHDKVKDEEKREDLNAFLIRLSRMEVTTWAFWTYIVLYIIAMFVGFGFKALFNIIAFIFLAIYLQSVFSVGSDLTKAKNTVYSYFLEKPAMMPEIAKRNIVVVIILSIITFSIYWLYLLVKLTEEIANFIKADQLLRRQVVESLTKGE